MGAEDPATSEGFAIVELILALVIIVGIFAPIVYFLVSSALSSSDTERSIKSLDGIMSELASQTKKGELKSTIIPITIAPNELIGKHDDRICAIMPKEENIRGRCLKYRSDTTIELAVEGGSIRQAGQHILKITLEKSDTNNFSIAYNE